MELKGAVAVVTGANRGLGRHLADQLVQRGAKVYAAARRPETVDLAGVTPLRLDVTDEESVRAAARVASDATLLVNNAGISTGATLISGELDAVRLELETNFFGPLALTRAFAPVIEGNGGGAVLNVLSALSWLHPAGLGSYAATKAATWAQTNAVREELAPAASRSPLCTWPTWTPTWPPASRPTRRSTPRMWQPRPSMPWRTASRKSSPTTSHGRSSRASPPLECGARPTASRRGRPPTTLLTGCVDSTIPPIPITQAATEGGGACSAGAVAPDEDLRARLTLAEPARRGGLTQELAQVRLECVAARAEEVRRRERHREHPGDQIVSAAFQRLSAGHDMALWAGKSRPGEHRGLTARRPVRENAPAGPADGPEILPHQLVDGRTGAAG